VLELQAHGGPVVLQLLLARCLQALPGARLADPGEFTQRAYLNDKLDLAQAEAVADLIDASTEAAARSAGRSLAGAFSAEVDALVNAWCGCACWSRPRWTSRRRRSTSSSRPMRRGQLDAIDRPC
jgi:tRNA U34 5-carboxymethylaminomethyl modifying GTPase MnmE/TrmE